MKLVCLAKLFSHDSTAVDIYICIAPSGRSKSLLPWKHLGKCLTEHGKSFESYARSVFNAGKERVRLFAIVEDEMH
ncbi:hypothetical protein M514_21629 [Trichuris suis]|uniref:Uncharacterized protein n=1 Tax=Trichuris suis TaxID=68888 RepID=A0A085N9G9_9BILA|nr:hypothetical protein M514_21629 [Trichuris suis]